MIPLLAPGPERFAELRDLLSNAGYTEPEICKRLGIRNLGELKAASEGRDPESLDSAYSVLLHLFLDREPALISVVREKLNTAGLDLLQSFGLLRTHPTDSQSCLATVMLYPVHDLYIASDRDWEPETGRGTLPRADAVYLAITPNAYDCIVATPVSPCEDFLDLCSGAAVAGLIAARDYAKASTACDIADRCTRFGEWNARLNGIANFTALTGDLYEPVNGKLFDRIVAHPPYVPSLEQSQVFRDGGVDGEKITRGIISGLPATLRPAGQCYLTAAFADVQSAPLEQRIRQMLGAQESEFDVLVAVRRRISLEDFLQTKNAAVRAKDGGIESFSYTSLLIQRRASTRPVFTIRRSVAAPLGIMLEWVARWESLRHETGFSDRFLRERIRPAEGVRLHLTQSLNGKTWTLVKSTLTTNKPFPMEEDCPPWVPVLLEVCANRPKVREAYEVLAGRRVLPSEASGTEFARIVQMLVSAGILEIETLPLP